MQAPAIPQTVPETPQFQPPVPQVLNQSSYFVPATAPAAYGYIPSQPVGYYQPVFNPYAYPTQAPSYWYGR
jgi:hypothetical protein